jgi:hypothetical protein
MTNLGDAIIRDLQATSPNDLRERLLEAMFMMERYRGAVCTGIDCVPHVIDADVGEAAIERLSEALESFIRTHPNHIDVGSAVWALGSRRDPKYVALFQTITEPTNGYTEWAREQASAALSYVT